MKGHAPSFRCRRQYLTGPAVGGRSKQWLRGTIVLRRESLLIRENPVSETPEERYDDISGVSHRFRNLSTAKESTFVRPLKLSSVEKSLRSGTTETKIRSRFLLKCEGHVSRSSMLSPTLDRLCGPSELAATYANPYYEPCPLVMGSFHLNSL